MDWPRLYYSDFPINDKSILLNLTTIHYITIARLRVRFFGEIQDYILDPERIKDLKNQKMFKTPTAVLYHLSPRDFLVMQMNYATSQYG